MELSYNDVDMLALTDIKTGKNGNEYTVSYTLTLKNGESLRVKYGVPTQHDDPGFLLVIQYLQIIGFAVISVTRMPELLENDGPGRAELLAYRDVFNRIVDVYGCPDTDAIAALSTMSQVAYMDAREKNIEQTH